MCAGQKGLGAIQGGSDKRIGLRDEDCVGSWGGFLGVWIWSWFRVWVIGYVRGMDQGKVMDVRAVWIWVWGAAWKPSVANAYVKEAE